MLVTPGCIHHDAFGTQSNSHVREHVDIELSLGKLPTQNPSGFS